MIRQMKERKRCCTVAEMKKYVTPAGVLLAVSGEDICTVSFTEGNYQEEKDAILFGDLF